MSETETPLTEEERRVLDVAEAIYERVAGKSWRTWMPSQTRAFWREVAKAAVEASYPAPAPAGDSGGERRG